MRRSRIAIIVIAVLVVSGLIFTCSKVLTPTPTTMPTPATTEYYQVGQRAETSREMLTVVSAERTDSYIRTVSMLELMFQPLEVLGGVRKHAAPGMVFIIIEAAVFNLGDRSLGISPRDFSLKDSEGREYPYIGYEGHSPYPSMKVAPMRPASGKFLFEVLEGASGLEVSCVLYGTPPVLAVWELEW